MTVETASYISQLSAANPAASDAIQEGDDHLRLIKSVLKTQFPSLGATAVSQTGVQMNKLGHEPGSVIMWAAGTAPTTTTIAGVKDWLLCDGSAYSTTTYSVLYGIIGAVFGASGSNFNVPDYRTYFPVGVGAGFTLGTPVSASAAAGTAVLKVQPINFLIKS
jgi:hypothetical protein